MSNADQARAYLKDLEQSQSNETQLLQDLRSQLNEAYEKIQSLEANVLSRRVEIRKAKQDLKKAESHAQLRELEHDVEELSAYFQSIAEGKAWYTGTGTGDQILPHQWQGVQFGAVARRWILGDGVGLGKTRQAIGWLDLIEAKKVVIVAEAGICDQFYGEVEEYAPHRDSVNLYKRAPEKRHELLDIMLSLDAAVVIVNYEIWRRDKDVLAKLILWEPDTVIVDEAHNLKKMSTSNFKGVKTLVAMDNICPRCHNHLYGLYDPEKLKQGKKILRPCSHCGWKKNEPTGVEYENKLEQELASKSVKNLMLITGTPILNTPEDLFSLLHLCNPVLFQVLEQFKRDYLINNYHSGKWEFRMGGIENLKPFIEHMFLARKPEDAGVILPEQSVVNIPIDMDGKAYPKQYRTIKQISEAAQIVLDSGESMTIMHYIALITRKRQANVWPGGIKLYDEEGNVIFDAGTEVQESIKFDHLMEIAKYHEGERQVVFSQFKTALRELELKLTSQGFRVARLDGDTSKKLRERIKTNFDKRMGEEPEWDILLANYKTGGTGLNFTAATVTHILDEEWNPGKRDQGYGRTRRIGQDYETTVYVYRIKNSIDTWMRNIIRHKERTVEGFEGTMFTNEVIQDLKTAIISGEML